MRWPRPWGDCCLKHPFSRWAYWLHQLGMSREAYGRPWGEVPPLPQGRWGRICNTAGQQDVAFYWELSYASGLCVSPGDLGAGGTSSTGHLSCSWGCCWPASGQVIWARSAFPHTQTGWQMNRSQLPLLSVACSGLRCLYQSAFRKK